MKLLMAHQKKSMTACRVLAMLYCLFKTDNLMLGTISIKHICNIHWKEYGDKQASELLRTWVEKTTQLDHPLDERHLRDMPYTKMQDSEGLKIPLLKYKEPPKPRTDVFLAVDHLSGLAV